MSVFAHHRRLLRRSWLVRVVACLLALQIVALGAPRIEAHAHAADHGHDHAGLLSHAVHPDTRPHHDGDPSDAVFHVHVACSCPCILPFPMAHWSARPLAPPWMIPAHALEVPGRAEPPPHRPPIV